MLDDTSGELTNRYPAMLMAPIGERNQSVGAKAGDFDRT